MLVEFPDRPTAVVADVAEIRAHVARVMESHPFARAPRMRRFLSFLVEETLEGRSAQLKEYTIATAVFGKPEDFDPGTSAVVRVEAGRLRRLLAQYDAEYASEDLLRIEIPKGSYIPIFLRHRPRTAGGAPSVRTPEPTPSTQERPIPWPTQERRFVTVLSCGLADESAKYALESDLIKVLDALHEQCAEIGLRHGGEVDASSSDRLMVYFGWPSALEFAAGHAISAALEMVARAQATCGDQPLALRIGVATSEVIARGPTSEQARFRASLIGEAPGLATRMQLRAPSNAILVSESTRRIAGAEFQFLAAGELPPAEGGGLVWRLLRPTSAKTRFRARHGAVPGEIVGRREERDLVLSRWRITQSGEGQTVLLSGEAGIGKSRLAEAVLDGIRADGIRLRAQCSPHHVNSGLYPLVELLRTRLGASGRLRNLDARASRALTRLGLDRELETQLLTELISGEDLQEEGALSASQRKEATFKLLVRLVLGLSKLSPVAILIEDVHWADPTTLEFLQDLIEAAQASRVLLILTSRPDGVPPFLRRTSATAVHLSRLPREDCGALIDRVADETDLSLTARNLILERAEGIPLFLEELTKLMLSGQPVDPRSAAVPESLSDLLAVHLDRLGPTRQIAQIASAIGRVFTRSMLGLAALQPEQDLEPALDQLLAAGIIVRDRGDAAQSFTFRHALLRDAAYRSLTEPTRRELHLRIGHMFVDAFPEVAAEHPEVIAHHLLEGGKPEDAVPFWIDAGLLAAARYSLAEATVHLRMALTALKSRPDGGTPERELNLLLELALVIRTARGYADEELLPIYERAQTLADGLSRPAEQLQVLYGLWTHAAGRGRWPRAYRLSEEFARRRMDLDADERTEVEALRLMGASEAFMGRFRDAREHHERAISLYDPARHGPTYGFDPGAAVAAYLSWTMWHLGDAAAGRRFAAAALAAAERQAHPPTLAMVLAWLIFHAVCEDDLEAIDRHNERLQSLCAERECRYWQPLGAACAEWAAFQRDGAPRHLERLVEYTTTFEERYLTSCLFVLAARMCDVLGRPDEGLTYVDRASALVREHNERLWEAEVLRVRAEILKHASDDHSEQIQTLLEDALDISMRQGASELERRVRQTQATCCGSTAEQRVRQRSASRI